LSENVSVNENNDGDCHAIDWGDLLQVDQAQIL
jgi:hypothetical protein